ncbi:sialate O-acetylesterase [Cellulophaga sp. 20_2_10]|uniref:sialate O-acetylesterase n=1 Tax=Cellulophaga sp. 20_2_10 TaxID=2942476 RepID=UPI00201A4D50|nr:sialate O-acetylesterase [Cellulophaga sp. 20_2_10]MCL5245319.1 sialate O-acetylesterase [Cellulophaga sp. 20_2_10]
MSSAQKKVKVILLSGQSNMAGAGNYDNLDSEIKNRIVKASKTVRLSFNGEEAKPLSYYDNKPSEKYNFKNRFGPELLLGVSLAEKYPNQEFLVVKKSMGGTALYGAWNPNWTLQKSEAVEKGEKKHHLKLYSTHIQDIKQNLDLIEKEGKTYTIIGLCWMQGENDAAKEVSARSYKVNLKELHNAYKRDLNLEKLPFVIGQINSTYGRFKEGPDMVRQAMADFCKENKNAILLKTTTNRKWKDYPKHTDNVHYNAEGQKRLGIAFGKKIIKLNK